MKTSVVETGRVIETGNGIATVRIDKGESCKGCGMGKIGLCKPGGSGMVMEVENPLGANKGDTVMLGLDSSTHLKGYLFSFILPLIMLVISTFVGYILSGLTGIGGLEIISGFLGLSVTVFFSLRKMRKIDKSKRMYIRRVLRDSSNFMWEADYGAEGGDYLEVYNQGD